MISTGVRPRLLINSDRLSRSIQELAEIGELPDSGVRRIAYSPDDLVARQRVQAWMASAGMTIRMDAAGNIIGTYPGKQPTLPALSTGSHIDTVPTGGRYDGAFGVLAGLEVVRVLQERQLQLRHPLELIVFTDEEGSMIGSKAMAGHVVNDPDYYRRPDGEDIRTCLKRIGGNWEQLPSAARSRQHIAVFLELHVEQGPILESMGSQIGIVKGIVGQRRYQITVTGQSNHAGTTPMYMRQDALVAAARMVLLVNEVGSVPGQQVATVGLLNVFPNAANVVPGRVEMSMDIRDLSAFHLESLMEQVMAKAQEIATQTKTTIDIQPMLRTEPAPAAEHVQRAIAQTCKNLGLTHTYLPSRASHDAQEIATFTDMGMIFVPSKAGLSHAEAEYTAPEQCTQGANVLLNTMLLLDEYYD